jgi:hypothetical protein
MAISLSNYSTDFYVNLYSRSCSVLAVHVIGFGLAQSSARISELRLSFQVDLELYRTIDNHALFNFDPAIRISTSCDEFNPLDVIQFEVSLNPELLSDLSRKVNDFDGIEAYLSKQSCDFQAAFSEIAKLENTFCYLKALYPVLFTENWLVLSVQQHLPTGTIGYKTLWSHFHSLGTSIEEASQEQISESISNFIQDLAGIGIDSQSQKLTPESLKETAALLRELASQTTDITSPEIIISQSLIFDVMISFFREEDWPFTKLEDQTVLRLAFEGKHGKWDCYAQAIEREQQFVFYSVCSFQIPRQKLNAIAEFITRANYGMVIGNFELDYSGGEIRYKTSIDVEGSTLDSALIKQLVYTNVLTMDQYLPGILAVLEQGMEPEVAIAIVESPTSP